MAYQKKNVTTRFAQHVLDITVNFLYRHQDFKQYEI